MSLKIETDEKIPLLGDKTEKRQNSVTSIFEENAYKANGQFVTKKLNVQFQMLGVFTLIGSKLVTSEGPTLHFLDLKTSEKTSLEVSGSTFIRLYVEQLPYCAICFDTGGILVLNRASGACLFQGEMESFVKEIQLAGEQLFLLNDQGEIRVCDLRGKEMFKIPPPQSDLTVQFQCRGKDLLKSSSEGCFLHSALTGDFVSTLTELPTKQIKRVGDDVYLLTVSGTVLHWNYAEQKTRSLFSSSMEELLGIECLGERLMVLFSKKGRIEIWDRETRNCIKRIETKHEKILNAFVSEGALVIQPAAQISSYELWDPESGGLLHRLFPAEGGFFANSRDSVLERMLPGPTSDFYLGTYVGTVQRFSFTRN